MAQQNYGNTTTRMVLYCCSRMNVPVIAPGHGIQTRPPTKTNGQQDGPVT